MSYVKEAYHYFLEEVWPDLLTERGLPIDTKPTNEDFQRWYMTVPEPLDFD